MTDDLASDRQKLIIGLGGERWKFLGRFIFDRRNLFCYSAIVLFSLTVHGFSLCSIIITLMTCVMYAVVFFVLTLNDDSRVWGDISLHISLAPSTKILVSTVQALIPDKYYNELKEKNLSVLKSEPGYIVSPASDLSFDLPCGYTAYPLYFYTSTIMSYINTKHIDNTQIMSFYHEIGHIARFQEKIMSWPRELYVISIVVGLACILSGIDWAASVAATLVLLFGGYLIKFYCIKADLSELVADTFAEAAIRSYLYNIQKLNNFDDDQMLAVQHESIQSFVYTLESQDRSERRMRSYVSARKHIDDIEKRELSRAVGSDSGKREFAGKFGSIEGMYYKIYLQRAGQLCWPLYLLSAFSVISATSIVALVDRSHSTPVQGATAIWMTALATTLFIIGPILVELTAKNLHFLQNGMAWGDSNLRVMVGSHNNFMEEYVKFLKDHPSFAKAARLPEKEGGWKKSHPGIFLKLIHSGADLIDSWYRLTTVITLYIWRFRYGRAAIRKRPRK